MKNFTLTASATGECCLSIQKYKPLTANVFKIIATHANKHYTEEQYAEAVANMSNNRLSLIKGTVGRHTTGIFSNNPHVEMLVQANTMTKAFNENNVKGMTVTASNQFMDSDTNIWKKVGEGESARLVLICNDDLEDILKERKSRRMTTQAAMIEEVAAPIGSYVKYFNPKAGEIQFGVKVKEGVIERNSVEAYTVEADQIIDVCVHDELQEVVSAVSNKGLTQVLNYMGKLFKDKSEFFSNLELLIKKRRAEGEEGNFEDTIRE